MSLHGARICPICDGKSAGIAFPFSTLFNKKQFHYLKCIDCESVFVDPIPDPDTFIKMYDKSVYHDCHYDGGEEACYKKSVSLLKRYLNPGDVVLDYGCGVGWFLKACSSQEMVPVGVEFDVAAAKFAALNAECSVMAVDAFRNAENKSFDAIHLGDVLEHLPNPAETLTDLIRCLKPNGVLFVEGPLEINPSLVFWSANIYGGFKRLFKPTFLSNHPPTHLFRINAKAQYNFLKNVGKGFTISYWEVYETGWPYTHGGLIKRLIANLAIYMGGHRFAGVTFGNRFKAVLVRN